MTRKYMAFFTMAAALSILLASSACSSHPPVQPPPPQAMPQVEPEPPPPSETPAPTQEEGPITTTVIEIGGEDGEGGQKSLLAAAQEAKENRKNQGPPVRVITDKNLSDHAVGKLTEAEPDSSAPSATTAVVRSTDDEKGEEYWRRAALDHRVRWREAVDEIERLEGVVADLRTRFYAEDDPYVRDGKIKPAWDRALDRLSDAREDAIQAELDLEAFLEEGKRAGALPGWLREGIHLEPESTTVRSPEAQDPREHVVGEPVVVDEDGEER